MRFSISVPQTVDGEKYDTGALRAYLARVEELGFDGAWTQEQVLGSAPRLSAIETMTFAAACTERLRLGCAVFVTPLHNPVQLAKSLSSLDQLSGGRIDVGVGTGGRHRSFSTFGVDPDGLVTRFTEGLRLMKELWTEPRVTFSGRFYQADGATMEPKPLQKPHPPIWFGAAHPDALRRAVRLGDGFFGAGSATTAQFADQVRLVRGALADAGGDSAGFPIAKRVYIAVDDDADRARARLADALSRLYGGRTDLVSTAVWGPPGDCVRGLRDVVDAGAELIHLNPLFDDAEQMERLAAEVMPELSASPAGRAGLIG